MTISSRARGASAIIVSSLLLTACGSGAATEPDPTSTPSPSGTEEATEATPRLVLAYDGGILVLDAGSLEQVGSAELDGFNRLNPAGDGRHVLVSTGDAFEVFDAGTWSEGHGDHDHYYVAEPALTDLAFESEKPGHVVRHDGQTILFHDRSGLVEIFDPGNLAEGLPETEKWTAPDAHHGVAVELSDGTLVTSTGNNDGANGIAVLNGAREVVATEECTGIHGEAVAAEEAVVVGCQSGVLIYDGGEITKVDSPDAYGRIGNQAGSEESPVVLGDYKKDKDAELERPETIALVNTDTKSLQLVDLGTSYSFRSLARGPHGEAIVLGTDGALHVLDPLTGEETAVVPVVEQWEEPLEWQEPRPTVFVQGHTAYVTEPASKRIHAVDLESGEILRSADLPEVPNELTGVTG
ncbi:hypothetical protein BJ994_003499 [Arthrobacter pigmenti]|uniref:Secreted protein n=1 Tax=Arthrobacter pigmenti TaxID=271432 RepID=A0A846RME5_9MICC|nr:zinc metallochaperone AztD [Arthrobacter pigmenti]NJC24423.1 hypothetical protein [Arthrobacter pigmenti]